MKIWKKNDLLSNLDKARIEYFNDGYIVIQNILDNEFIDNLNNSLGLFKGRKKDEWTRNKYVKEVGANKFIYKILKEFYNDTPLPFQTINFTYGTEQSLHSDLMHFSPSEDNLERMCGVWYALEDISDEKGPLIFYRYSHKEKCITNIHDFPVEKSKLNTDLPNYEYRYKKYSQYLTKLVKEKNLKKKYGNIPKGSVIIWCSNLIHGGSPERNKNLTRKSMVTHYFFSKSKYFWSPKISTPNKKVIRNNINEVSNRILK